VQNIVTPTSQPPSIHTTQYYYLHTYVGAILTLEEQGIVGTGGGSGGSSADLHTNLYVDALNDGVVPIHLTSASVGTLASDTQVTITSASGVDYSTPDVPEPSTGGLLLVGGGLIAVGLGKRKFRPTR
jgi:hypothetical protein